MQFNISLPSQVLASSLQQKIDQKTKPLGALGMLESIASQVALIQQTLSPELRRPSMLIFAADHGVVAAGVSQYPQAVTAQMVLNFLCGGAAINVFARQHGFVLRVIDAGVNHNFGIEADLVDAKIGLGTKNFLSEPAMSTQQAWQAIERGASIARREIESGSNVIAFGEMGIGNTSSASCLMSVLCDMPIELCAGRGTGLDDTGLIHKIAVLKQALEMHALTEVDAIEVLAAVGGFEIAMMAGAMLAAAEQNAVLLIDGFIATSALLVASKLHPEILHYCIFGHCSGEAGHRLLLDYLSAKPLLDLGMRLGEGTGAVLAYPLLQAAINFLNDMASFESAGVSNTAGSSLS